MSETVRVLTAPRILLTGTRVLADGTRASVETDLDWTNVTSTSGTDITVHREPIIFIDQVTVKMTSTYELREWSRYAEETEPEESPRAIYSTVIGPVEQGETQELADILFAYNGDAKLPSAQAANIYKPSNSATYFARNGVYGGDPGFILRENMTGAYSVLVAAIYYQGKVSAENVAYIKVV